MECQPDSLHSTTARLYLLSQFLLLLCAIPPCIFIAAASLLLGYCCHPAAQEICLDAAVEFSLELLNHFRDFDAYQ